jgi:hypothetical protein
MRMSCKVSKSGLRQISNWSGLRWHSRKSRHSPANERIVNVRMTPDGKFYASSFLRELSDLYLVEGVK